MKTQAKQLNEALMSGNGPTLIDVRTPAEYDEIHIDGSHLMPLDRLDAEAVRSLVQDTGAVLLCASGKRAEQALRKLSAAGIGSLTLLDGGLTAWDAAGLPANRGRKGVSLERQVRIAAGFMVLAGVALGTWAHSGFYAISGFVGAGLMFAGIADWCGMATILAKMPWNQRSGVGPVV